MPSSRIILRALCSCSYFCVLEAPPTEKNPFAAHRLEQLVIAPSSTFINCNGFILPKAGERERELIPFTKS